MTNDLATWPACAGTRILQQHPTTITITAVGDSRSACAKNVRRHCRAERCGQPSQACDAVKPQTQAPSAGQPSKVTPGCDTPGGASKSAAVAAAACQHNFTHHALNSPSKECHLLPPMGAQSLSNGRTSYTAGSMDAPKLFARWGLQPCSGSSSRQ